MLLKLKIFFRPLFSGFKRSNLSLSFLLLSFFFLPFTAPFLPKNGNFLTLSSSLKWPALSLSFCSQKTNHFSLFVGDIYRKGVMGSSIGWSVGLLAKGRGWYVHEIRKGTWGMGKHASGGGM